VLVWFDGCVNVLSPTWNAIVAVFVYVPLAPRVTVTPTVPPLPAPRFPSFHVTVPPANVPPLVADTNVAPAGSGSVITAFSAGVGPPFE
jgi:hypothetical protein